jgi:hypothetical protein
MREQEMRHPSTGKAEQRAHIGSIRRNVSSLR